MEFEHETGWKGLERRDGVRVAVADGGAWLVLTPDDRLPLSVCPTCDRAMRTADTAKLVADAVYPPR